MPKHSSISVIGSGFSSLATAACLAQVGHKVDVYEKNESVGGRARQFKADGFTFDMGPSWYWMPDVFERYFNRFGKSTSDYYELLRLSPSYRIFFGKDEIMDVPSNLDELYEVCDSIEPGSSKNLKRFLAEAKVKYEVGMNHLVYKPGNSFTEFIDPGVLSNLGKLKLHKSIDQEVDELFKSDQLRQLLKFPVLFLGAKPSNIPSLYSLMNYADIALGTWYPMGGMHKIVEAMESLAVEMGVEFHLNHPISSIPVQSNRATGVINGASSYMSDVVVAGADYHHVESKLLAESHRNYSTKSWNKKTMAPSALIIYMGVNKKLNNIEHHNLFFDKEFGKHAEEIYDNPKWPEDPLFYVCAPSITDKTVAPEGHENLFFLVPLAPGLEDTNEKRNHMRELILNRFENLTGNSIKENIVYERMYCVNDFKSDYNAYKGNAYGLANTLNQTAILKPKIRNKKVKNLYYTGQLTVPGPGVPPSIISGQIVADQIINS